MRLKWQEEGVAILWLWRYTIVTKMAGRFRLRPPPIIISFITSTRDHGAASDLTGRTPAIATVAVGYDKADHGPGSAAEKARSHNR